MNIRKATESDRQQILTIHKQAFGSEKGDEIAKLVDDLLEDETAKPILSLVATEGDIMRGHVLFTKVKIAGARTPINAQILAPLAIQPDSQKKGVGQLLINEGLRHLKQKGVELVFVLGHPTYYPRCGFAPAGIQGFEAPYPIPDEHAGAWMVLELNGNHLGKARGKIQCSKVLNEPQHWRE